MAWTTSLNDLRNLLADNTQNRFCYRKKVFGSIDGVNAAFKTFEPRRITDFSAASGEAVPVGLYLNGEALTTSDVQSDDVISGEVILANAPSPTFGSPAKPSVLTATYYYHWFFDSELQNFLANAVKWLQQSSDITQMPDPLQPAALYYAASDAFQFLSARWAERASTAFLLEDAPAKSALNLAKTFTDQATAYAKRGTELRNDYYTRSGQALAPNFVSSWGQVGAVTPRR